MIAEDPGYLASYREFLFLLDLSSFGLQASWAFLFFRGPFTPASLDLACFFPFGPGSLFWASLTMIPFRPQHLDNSNQFLFDYLLKSIPTVIPFIRA